MRIALIVATLAVAAIARADTAVTVQLTPEGEQLAQQLGVTPAQLAAQVKAAVDNAYQTSNINEFLRSFVDATSFSARGIGVDYASSPTGFVAGIAVNVAAAGDSELRADERPTAGLAANLAVMLGMNLSEWKLPRWTFYANGFYRNAELERLDGTILSAGAHVQYTIIPAPTDGGTGKFVRWIGLAATGGLELTRWQLGTGSDTLTTDFDVGSGNNTAHVDVDSTGQLDLRTQAITVPLEATTGLRVMWLATLYAGVGIDFTLGNADLTANMTGDARSDDGRQLGTVTITGEGYANGSPATVRGLVGVQLNLWKLKLFAQLNASQSPAASVAFGLKFVQ
ncbi:MAG TPA: hypothetical protein VK509_21425 [Polyangiales bacterium]|nr:hypothetical protein [Polyangiales bacterium]